ncbi:arsenate reductase (glutaredoxin) [Flavobacteriales bacterium 34_180_T64]|nr:arsenate reductase (glutaredoxin) [Flavobacteriales bacterium 34_180_T64]
MIVIYHNPRCSKSRETVDILNKQNAKFEIIKYLEEPLSVENLTEIIKLLNIKPIELVRQNESIWKENFRHLDSTDQELIKIMSEHPKLIERPIVINGDKAVIGRPPNRILDII